MDLMTHNSPMKQEGADSRGRRGFTLTEILVVIGLIVLMLALAMPTFNFMSGNTSIEGTANTVSAILAKVRQDAIALQKDRGVVIYQDVEQDRLVAAYLEYKDANFSMRGTGPSYYLPDDYAAGAFYSIGDYVFTPLNGNQIWVCIEPNKGLLPDTTYPAVNYWRKIPLSVPVFNAVASKYKIMDAIFQSDRITLPKVADIRGIGRQQPNASVTTPETLRSYSNPAVFIFDGTGQLVHRRYCLLSDGIIGKSADLANSKSLAGSPPIVNAVLITPNQMMNTSQTALSLFKTDDAKTNGAEEDQEGTWYAENARPYLINRYNGTLIKGE